MPLKKSVRSQTAAEAKKSTRSAKIANAIGTIGASALVMALLCVLAAAMLTGAHQPSETAADAPSDAASAQPIKRVAMRGPSAAVPATMPTTGATMADAADAASAAPAKKGTPVTVAGCLVRENDTFRLKDTSGADAPKARSWKSGFLKKGSASLDLADGGSAVKLRDHVGKRVSVSGMLVDRQVQVRSLRRVAPSCN